MLYTSDKKCRFLSSYDDSISLGYRDVQLRVRFKLLEKALEELFDNDFLAYLKEFYSDAEFGDLREIIKNAAGNKHICEVQLHLKVYIYVFILIVLCV